MTHLLRIETGYADGDKTVWEYEQPGNADDAHNRLFRQWWSQKARFTRCREDLRITREYDHPELGPYVQTVTHIPIQEPA